MISPLPNPESRRGTLVLADATHPMRFGGSALTLMDVAEGKEQGTHLVCTARLTNKGDIIPPREFLRIQEAAGEVGAFKNAGGLPDNKEAHLNPTLTGQIEGVEEIAFCNGDMVLCPTNLNTPALKALETSVTRVNQFFSKRDEAFIPFGLEIIS